MKYLILRIGKMYSEFADEFSRTRRHAWPCVERFLKGTQRGTLLDAGCGNGRNIIAAINEGYDASGFDICPEFVSICKSRGLKAHIWDLKTPILETYDTIICIAVLHHLETDYLRQEALQNMYNALNNNGSMFVTMWSYETEGAKYPKEFTIGDNQVMWKLKSPRYYYIFDRSHLEIFIGRFQEINHNAKITIEWEEQNWNITIRKDSDS